MPKSIAASQSPWRIVGVRAVVGVALVATLVIVLSLLGAGGHTVRIVAFLAAVVISGMVARHGTAVRWVARALGLFIVATVALMAIWEQPAAGPGAASAPSALEFATTVSVRVFAGVLAFACLLAWFREKAGGWLLIVVGAGVGAFVVTVATKNPVGAAVALGLPVVLLGVLFVVADALCRSAAPQQKVQAGKRSPERTDEPI